MVHQERPHARTKGVGPTETLSCVPNEPSEAAYLADEGRYRDHETEKSRLVCTSKEIWPQMLTLPLKDMGSERLDARRIDVPALSHIRAL